MASGRAPTTRRRTADPALTAAETLEHAMLGLVVAAAVAGVALPATGRAVVAGEAPSQ